MPSDLPLNSLIDIVSPYVQLQKGSKVLKGPCPFHADTNNSFMIAPDKNIFKCFGCGKEGGPQEFLNYVVNK